MVGWVILGLVVLAGLFLIALYNRLVRNKNLVAEAWSGIDVQLKRRADLIPNLVDTVKGYLVHERQLLEEIAQLRTQSLAAQKPQEQARVEGQLEGALARLFAVAENYPDLKASQNFLQLQQSLADLEGELQLARRYYNGAARDYNIQVQSFPSNLMAGALGFTAVEYYQLEDQADRQRPSVSFS